MDSHPQNTIRQYLSVVEDPKLWCFQTPRRLTPILARSVWQSSVTQEEKPCHEHTESLTIPVPLAPLPSLPGHMLIRPSVLFYRNVL